MIHFFFFIEFATIGVHFVSIIKKQLKHFDHITL